MFAHVLLTLSLLAPQQATAAPAWTIQRTSGISNASALLDVSASGASDAWAVGYGCSAEDNEGCPAIQRWNGRTWRKVTDARTNAYHAVGVSAASPNNVWVVGNGTTAWAGHWNGRAWTSYQPFGAAEHNRISDVAVSGRPWFAGSTADGRGVVLSWSKARGFRTVFANPGSLNAITARSATGDVWAVGANGSQPMIVHGSNGRFTEHRAPLIPGGVLTRVWQAAKNDVWAVGHTGGTFATSKPLVLRYDGRSWRQVSVPVAKGRLTGVTSDGAGVVWASGVDFAHGRQVLLIRLGAGRPQVSWSQVLTIPNQRDYDPDTVTKVSISRVPGTRHGLWAAVAAGGGDFETHFLMRRK
ncbi:hypothetical protein Aph01nite_65910 [Acrocarpospora phusangensis]|uniref:Uncharacterized protein n=1 Tax=Acrocarpospora phusangensis TaxID=1070424 RepID=A0A919QI48_9ACTN|nr:hypothetical protein [Acrocarpospora phusangensis]GIH28281.1 hypothetical protein Aph01nite_65910 [Acrocarpospora phusangensis]